MKKLNVDVPDFQPKATEYVDSMIEKIKYLESKGCAYNRDGHILFSVSLFLNMGYFLKGAKKNKLQEVG